MANWCENVIKITGAKSNLDFLKSKLKDYKDENVNFMEYVISLGDIPDNYYEQGWCNYNVKRFGTKWEIPLSELELTIEEDSISIIVNSAEDPIVLFLLELCKSYNVDATIDYYEPVNDIGGRAEFNSDGTGIQYLYSYMEALYLYANEVFFGVVLQSIKDKLFDDFEEIQQSFSFLSKDDIVKVESIWNINKYNL
jgi:hypothetical protein